MPDRDRYPPAEDSIARLRRAGWTCGETAFTDANGRMIYQVDATHREKRIRVECRTAADAWARAVLAAAEVGGLDG